MNIESKLTLQFDADDVQVWLKAALKVVNASKFSSDEVGNVEDDPRVNGLIHLVRGFARSYWQHQTERGISLSPLEFNQLIGLIEKDRKKHSKESKLTVVDKFKKDIEKQKEDAQKLFDYFVKNKPKNDFESLTDGSEFRRQDELEKMIRSTLNWASLKDFVDIVLKHQVSASQSAKAYKRHAENRAMKVEIFAWLDVNRENYKSMDEVAIHISNEIAPIAFRTARDWVAEWKKLRSAGTP